MTTMKNLSRLTLLFSILFAVMFIGPALLGSPFGPFPLMKNGDVFDVLTPLVLIPIYWLLLRAGRREAPALGESLAFLVLAACWVEGQGMHLSANSIGHLLKAAPESQAYALTYVYDEVLGHYRWHFGAVGLTTLLLVRQWRQPVEGEAGGRLLPLVAGLLHGLVYFIIVVEAGTAPLGVTFALGVVAFSLAWGRRRLAQQPIWLFFFVAYAVACLFFAGWAIYWGGLPQFSQVGIID